MALSVLMFQTETPKRDNPETEVLLTRTSYLVDASEHF